jgi:DNA polymerase I-like protein with 3'-5' exonuclease and polymerase domains
MARYAFDIETNGLLDQMDRIHSLVLTDVDTGQTYSCTDHEYDAETATLTSALTVKQGVELLMDADQIIGHNIIKFDIPAIQLIHPWFSVDEDQVFDTLVMSRLLWPDLMDRDGKAVKLGRLLPKNRGRHSLDAWGQRLGEWKGDYSQITQQQIMELNPEISKAEAAQLVWAEWSPAMQEYCEQDVRVTVKFLELIESKNTDPRAIELEHRVAHIVAEQERYGFKFDYEGAWALLGKLQEERAEIESRLQDLFDPWYSFDSSALPKRSVNYKDVTRHSTWAGAPYTKIKRNVFNPGSRAHIADRLMKVRGWKPSDFTSNGQPKIDDEILGNLPYPEAQQISYYLMLQKRIGQIAEGKNSWINLFNHETGRIHGSVVTNGAVTGRMTHNYPNVAQTPSVGKPFGKECRSLWTVPVGKKLVGVDVSGLELRMLAHFMAPHDGGEYGETVVNGDIHTVNMEAAGLPERNMAKTFIYAFLYGAGNEKIGSIVGKGAQHGGVLKKRFLEQTPALNKLIKGVSKAARTRGCLTGLDGRTLHIRHQHAALNTLLQSAGALVCKRWAVEVEDELRRRGWKDRVQVVANIHDEHQYECDEEIAEEMGELSVECIKRAGEYFRIRIPLDGEANIGNNWKETH